MVIDRKQLPYNVQLIFISYFFSQVIEPSERHKKKLKQWFWITTYSNYFTISLSKIRLAFDQFKRFVKDEEENSIFQYEQHPTYVVESEERWHNHRFSEAKKKNRKIILLSHHQIISNIHALDMYQNKKSPLNKKLFDEDLTQTFEDRNTKLKNILE
jgi:hypothetical protein